MNVNNRLLIINADDFGLTPGVNKGIQYLHQQGRITSTSLLVNMAWSSEAIDYAKQHQDLATGTHLNLTHGPPVSPVEKVPSLVNATGHFHSNDASEIAMKLFTKQIHFPEVERELRAQIELCLANGIQPTHLDSHMHFHGLMGLKQLTKKLAKEYKIPVIRNPHLYAFVGPTQGGLLTNLMFGMSKFWHNLMSHTAKASHRTETTPLYCDHLLYLRWCIESEENTMNVLLTSLQETMGNTVEIIAHPSFEDDLLASFSSYVGGRKQELDFLMSAQLPRILDKLHFSLVKPNALNSTT